MIFFFLYNFKFLYNQYLINDRSSEHLSIMVTETETIRLTLSFKRYSTITDMVIITVTVTDIVTVSVTFPSLFVTFPFPLSLPLLEHLPITIPLLLP